MLKSIRGQCAAWFAVLICACLLAGIPAHAGLASVTQESTAAGVAARVTPVILDPESGRQIAVWSEFDGISNKIAYARLENGVWTDYHYLTFGHGNDTAPRIATTRDGSFLFWIADGRRYVYAPLDLAGGRLHASPRRVPLESSGLHLVAVGSGMGTGTEGGSDVPVVTEECPPEEPNCELTSARDDRRMPIVGDGGSDVPIVTECPPNDTQCLTVRSSRDDRRQRILSEGGTDIPVVADSESLWSVTSRPGCNLIVLSIPSVEAGAYHLLKLESGRLDRAGRIRLQPGSTHPLPAATAAPILDSACF